MFSSKPGHALAVWLNGMSCRVGATKVWLLYTSVVMASCKLWSMFGILLKYGTWVEVGI